MGRRGHAVWVGALEVCMLVVEGLIGNVKYLVTLPEPIKVVER